MPRIKYSEEEKQRAAALMVEENVHYSVSLLFYFLVQNEDRLGRESDSVLNVTAPYEDKVGETHEIFEQWIVSGWLGNRLQEKEEKVDEVFGMKVWGRTCTGQAICLDNNIQEIAIENGYMERFKQKEKQFQTTSRRNSL